MTTRIAFLRAVNLGKRTVDMAALASLVEGLGYSDVWTYINSGNVVFAASGPRAGLEAALERAFEETFGFEVTTFVRSAAELRKIAAATPFTVEAGDTHFVTLLKAPLDPEAGRALEGLGNDFDTLVADGRDVHWRMHGRSTDSKLHSKDWERIVGRHQSTSRNMTMVRKLLGRLGGL